MEKKHWKIRTKEENRANIKKWFEDNMFGTQRACAEALGLEEHAVCIHIREMTGRPIRKRKQKQQ